MNYCSIRGSVGTAGSNKILDLFYQVIYRNSIRSVNLHIYQEKYTLNKEISLYSESF